MNRKLIPCLVAALFAATAAWAADEDEFTWNGSSIGIGVRGTRQEGGTRNGAYGTSATTTAPFAGPQDKAKLNEYRDVSNGVTTNIDLQGSSSQNYLRFFGENFNLDDEYLNLRGGRYGIYKYQLYEDKMPHNLSWGALTPLSGTGGTALTVPGAVAGNPAYPPAQNPATWNQFDYRLQRNTYGGNFEFTDNTPWHSRIDFSETTMKGVRPQGGRLGTSSNNGMIELGAPVDYKTRSYSLESGYSTKAASFSINVLNSKFSNSDGLMQWTNFYMLNGLDTSLLPPDNDLTKLSLNGTLRQLPVNSTLAARLTWSILTNSFGVTSGGLMPTSNASPPTAVGTLVTGPSFNTFEGEHETKSASLSLASAWGAGVDTKIYYNYYHTKNKSTLIEYALGGLGTDAANCPSPSFPSTSTANRFCIGPYPNSLFFYKKQDYGIDAGWRINRGNKVSGGVNLLEIDREREDAEKTKEDKIWLEYKNSMLEDLSGRIKVQRLERRSDLNAAFPPGTSPFSTGNTPAQVAYYFRAYDVSNADQDQIKLVLDWAPIPFLDTGFEAAWKKTDYKDLFYGRNNDLRREYNVTVSYGNPKEFRVTGLVNYETVEFNQAYHQGTGPFPGGTQTATDFDWGTKNTQTNRLIGVIADWPVMERLALKGSYTWSRTGGGVDFNSGNTAGAGGFLGGPLVNYVTDNTRKRTFNLKGDYKVDRHWTATAGYVHETYDYADDQMRGYQGFYPYFQNLGGTNNSWFSGAFANPSYKLDVLYLVATYKF
jgi:MtrB/PioB family decaheme-associated outer membrane protein